MSQKKKIGGSTKPASDSVAPEITHFAVPVILYGVVIKILETLPYGQVSSAMKALQECQPLAFPTSTRVNK